MFAKATLAAVALATTLAAAPIATTSANASPAPNFYFGIQTPNGYFGFGTGGGYYPQPLPQPQPQAMSCWQAKNYLGSQFAHVWKVECNGAVYTFHVKNNWGPVKTVKINKFSGNYWFV